MSFVKFTYGYEVGSEDKTEAVIQAFKEHMKELSEGPRPIVEVFQSQPT